ncbi:MAG: glutathione S-transferase N-terminal domain-containing protein [Gammaproteobacteria bacterium]|nr:glutathione S-transferase N-terminal domain-containing protein [Gammaproteobacteria bacterium]MCW8988064.1 glutathione S-transferase N-terminal domain-containing protein [Gammaproteobacteria bacterium]
MKLYYSSTSPFVRKVNIFAIEAGLDQQLEWVKTNPWQAEDHLTTENPLSKIPTLITDDDEIIYDSRVICEYLDTLHTGEKMIPAPGEARWQVLRLQALADGVLDAGILRFMEKKRTSDMQSTDWDEMQKGAVERGLDHLEYTVSDWATQATQNLNIGVISVACVLGWLDFRFSHENWRINRPNLQQWFEAFSKRDSMLKTLPKE